MCNFEKVVIKKVGKKERGKGGEKDENKGVVEKEKGKNERLEEKTL